MIYAELAGGLGNQMFIYAFARALGLRCGESVTLLDRQDWRDGAPAHTVCALEALNIAPEVKILAQPGFAKAHLPRQNAAKALMIKYEQRKGLLARDWNGGSAAAPRCSICWGCTLPPTVICRAPGPVQGLSGLGVFPGGGLLCGLCRHHPGGAAGKSCPRRTAGGRDPHGGLPVAVHLRRGDYCKPENAILQVCTRPTTPGPPPRRRPPTPRRHFLSFRMIRTGQRKISTPPDCPPSGCPGARRWRI